MLFDTARVTQARNLADTDLSLLFVTQFGPMSAFKTFFRPDSVLFRPISRFQASSRHADLILGIAIHDTNIIIIHLRLFVYVFFCIII